MAESRIVPKHPHFKIVITGRNTPGTTSLVTRLTKNKFDETTDLTLGTSFSYMIFGQVTAHIWDVNTSNPYAILRQVNYKNANLTILCFNAEDLLQNTNKTLNLINKEVQIAHAYNRNKHDIILAITQCDKLSQKNREALENITVKIENISDYVVCSAKTAMGCDKLLSQITSIISRTYSQAISSGMKTATILEKIDYDAFIPPIPVKKIVETKTPSLAEPILSEYKLAEDYIKKEILSERIFNQSYTSTHSIRNILR